MNAKLTAPIMLYELELVVKHMAKGKTPCPNGVAIEYFV
jgi:hypothetical protein